uniref:DNA methyltransferase n=1 Tax=Pontiella sp. TaxID=2837462 RepID=UPI00356AE3C9
MKYADVAENVRRLMGDLPPQDEFIYELLLAYGKPKASITRLKQGTYNQSKVPGEVLWKKELYFKAVLTTEHIEKTGNKPDQNLTTEVTKDHRGKASCASVSFSEAGGENSLYAVIEALKKAKGTNAHNPRFLFVTDFKQILAVDRKTNDTLDIPFQKLETNVDFFLPWAGMEKTKLSNENPADIKAAEKMAKLFDAIKLDNPQYMREDEKRDERLHAMNVFLGRLLFCLFAEDTGIFDENAVTNAIASHTADDGSDLDVFFKQLFDWLDTPDHQRKDAESAELRKDSNNSSANPCELGAFALNPDVKDLPYVNGGLFRDHFDIPTFSAKSRRMIIESGSLNWSEINPDIFGSMFQAVIDPEERHNLGQHYTSVTNIMKVIEPLFLNDLKEQFEKANNRVQNKKRVEELHQLLERIWNLKIFDPACGSGNFLIIAYKELRRLEMEIFEALNEFPVSKIRVDQFYGIEIADFACETAILALWLAEHQMNLEFTKRFKHSLTSLPLKDGANIVCDNACRKGWSEVCPKEEGDEIYVLGNPPYLGARNQSPEQKDDLESVFDGQKEYKDSDY